MYGCHHKHILGSVHALPFLDDINLIIIFYFQDTLNSFFFHVLNAVLCVHLLVCGRIFAFGVVVVTFIFFCLFELPRPSVSFECLTKHDEFEYTTKPFKLYRWQ